MINVRLIDENGIFIEDVQVEELTEITIETPIPETIYAVSGITPKWVGEWVEVVARPIISVVEELTLEQKVAEQELVINDLISLLADKGVIY